MGCGKSTRGGVVGFSGYVELGVDGQGVGEGTPAGGHQLGRSRPPLPCGSGQLYN